MVDTGPCGAQRPQRGSRCASEGAQRAGEGCSAATWRDVLSHCLHPTHPSLLPCHTYPRQFSKKLFSSRVSITWGLPLKNSYTPFPVRSAVTLLKRCFSSFCVTVAQRFLPPLVKSNLAFLWQSSVTKTKPVGPQFLPQDGEPQCCGRRPYLETQLSSGGVAAYSWLQPARCC